MVVFRVAPLLLGLLGIVQIVLAASPNNGWHCSREVDQYGNPMLGWDGSFGYITGLGIGLVRLYVHLSIETTTRSQLIKTLPALLAKGNNEGVSFILRFYYDNGEAPMNVIANDLSQLVPVVTANKKYIYALQAGFLGAAYGEWWGGVLAPDYDPGWSSTVRAAKSYVVQELKKTGLPILIRYPRDIATYFPDDPQIGWHDDCILANGPGGHDAGTFSKGGIPWPENDLGAAMIYSQHKIQGIRGGESCSDAGTAPDCPALLTFVKNFKICFLNVEYPSNFFGIYKASSSSCTSSLMSAMRSNCEDQFSTWNKYLDAQSKTTTTTIKTTTTTTTKTTTTTTTTTKTTTTTTATTKTTTVPKWAFVTNPVTTTTTAPPPAATTTTTRSWQLIPRSDDNTTGCWAPDQPATIPCTIGACGSQYCTPMDTARGLGHECTLLQADFCANELAVGVANGTATAVVDPVMLGCFATDQRPYVPCSTAGCTADHCTELTDKSPAGFCRLFRGPQCRGTWPSLGCFTANHRPWVACNDTDCPSGRCTQNGLTQAAFKCLLLKDAECRGSWPPQSIPVLGM